MIAETSKQAVGFFPNHQDAETARNKLIQKGFNISQVTIVAKDEEAAKTIDFENVKQIQNQLNRDGAKAGAITGIITGFFFAGLLGGLSTRVLAEETPIANVGIIFVNALLGGAIGIFVCSLIGALIGWTLTKKLIKPDNSQTNEKNNYLVVVEDTPENIQNARSVITSSNIK